MAPKVAIVMASWTMAIAIMMYMTQGYLNTVKLGTRIKNINLIVGPEPHREHSTITCQMDETESEFDRRCHL